MTCKNCYSPLPTGSKYCPNCGTELEKNEANENKSAVDEITLSTGDYKGEYKNLGIVHHYHLTLQNKEKFGEKNLSFDDTVDNIIDLLIDETIQAGGDGIIWLRVEFHPMQLAGTQIFVYGTMIKRK